MANQILPSVPNMTFGLVPIKNTASLSFSLANEYAVEKKVAIRIGNILSPESYVFSSQPQVSTILPGASYTFNVKFSPANTTLFSTFIYVFNETFTELYATIPLQGQGQSVPLVSTDNQLSFNLTYAHESSSKTFNISNYGTSNLVISNLSIVSGSSDYFIQGPNSGIIAPDSSMSFEIIFRPNPTESFLSSGNRSLTGQLKITNNAGPDIFVNLIGKTSLREGAWRDIDLSDLLPETLLNIVKLIEDTAAPINTAMKSIQTLQELSSSISTSINLEKDAILLLVEAARNVVNDEIENFRSTGLYLLPIYPVSFSNDDKIKGRTEFESMVASVGGGAQMFKQKIIDSFDDRFDGNRPQFNDAATVGAIVVAVDSGNFDDVVKGWRKIKGIFNNIEWKSAVIPPSGVIATGQNQRTTISWLLPDVFSYDLTFGLSDLSSDLSSGSLLQSGQAVKQKINLNPISFIHSFEVYRSELPNNLFVAQEELSETILKDDVYTRTDTIDTVERVKVEPLFVIPAGEYFQNSLGELKNLDPRSSSSPKNSLIYNVSDTGVENNRTYYYTIRTVMKSGDKSDLSVEVHATPIARPVTADYSGFKRCANLKCSKTSSVRKQIPLTGFSTENLTVKGQTEQISKFVLSVDDKNPALNGFIIYNYSLATRWAMGQQKIDGERTRVDLSGITIDNFDTNQDTISSDLEQRRQIFFNTYARRTSLSIGTELIPSKEKDSAQRTYLKLTMYDLRSLGYEEGDSLVIKYSTRSGDEVFSCKVGSQFLEPEACNNGINESYCPSYTLKRCVYHGGDKCLNVGNTKRYGDDLGSFKILKNASLFEAGLCQSGEIGAQINDVDRPFINSPDHSVLACSGTCSGYVSVGDVKNTVGQFPDWKNVSVGGMTYLMPSLDKLFVIAQNFVDAQFAGLQNIASTTDQFVDLFDKKIKSLDRIVDQLSEIVRLMNVDFSGPGFHVLNIAPEPGGIKRIKQKILGASGGPDSGIEGYTSGIVILYGSDPVVASLLGAIFGLAE